MLITTTGLILRTVKYSETSVICDIFTLERGLQTYIVSGVRQAKSRIGSSTVRQMMWVELVAFHNELKDIQRVREIKPVQPLYRRLLFEVLRSSLATFITEIVQKTIKEREKDEPLFHFLWTYYQWLDNADTALSNVHLLFLVQFTEFLGFLPDDTFFPEAWFDYAEGTFLVHPPLHLYYFDQDSSRLLHLFLNQKLETVHSLGITQQQRRDFLKNMLHYYQYHIDNFPIIHSHSVLQEIL